MRYVIIAIILAGISSGCISPKVTTTTTISGTVTNIGKYGEVLAVPTYSTEVRVTIQ